MNIQEMIRKAAALLEQENVDSPQLSARILAQKVLGLDALGLVMEAKTAVSDQHLEEYESLVSRRATGEPAAYILAQREFFGLDFEVNPHVLIPRPETEEMIELVQKYYSANSKIMFADFGTGSGIISITLASLFQNSHGIGLDISLGACSTALRNSRKHNVDGRLQFLQADFTTDVIKNGSLDLVVANPPYLSQAELGEISREVYDFEPCGALVGGPRGDELIKSSIPVIAGLLKKNALVFMEIGYLQGETVKDLFESADGAFTDVYIQKDISGHDRIAVARKR
ncbi:peptide chain release factor N(5)-glutamine methyltransferase [Maridesulfovibrio bastinii]|uniref:peptide chain release factor N(5)-glutamine methyltransferase n=1 Tax=Maridesulfovibrio bastinii TaxID=47157 RepID=UPI00054FDB13|nr:peptide chain release factor N(5)-glutamine methyltransferase [Maridesulfovibrio bastinii]